MEESLNIGSAARLFERNDALVIEAFRRGEFDYLEGVGEISETDFFRTITTRKVLEKLAATYPAPGQKQDVPIWAYIAGDISMRFHGVNQFNAFPYVVRSGHPLGGDDQCLWSRHGTQGRTSADGRCDTQLFGVQ